MNTGCVLDRKPYFTLKRSLMAPLSGSLHGLKRLFGIHGVPETECIKAKAFYTSKLGTPPAGKIKINVDGSWKARKRWAGIGVVCRDSTGRVLLSAYQRTHAAGGPSQIEALAFRYGLLLAHRHNWWNIQLEGDSQALVSNLMSGSITNSYQSVVLEEVLALGEALNCEYLYTPRLNNAVADSLALLGRLACTDSEYLQLDGLPPSATASVCYNG